MRCVVPGGSKLKDMVHGGTGPEVIFIIYQFGFHDHHTQLIER